LPADQQAIAVNVVSRKQVIDDPLNVPQRVLDSRKGVPGIA
jgi:hypothetical protein